LNAIHEIAKLLNRWVQLWCYYKIETGRYVFVVVEIDPGILVNSLCFKKYNCQYSRTFNYAQTCHWI